MNVYHYLILDGLKVVLIVIMIYIAYPTLYIIKYKFEILSKKI